MSGPLQSCDITRCSIAHLSLYKIQHENHTNNNPYFFSSFLLVIFLFRSSRYLVSFPLPSGLQITQPNEDGETFCLLERHSVALPLSHLAVYEEDKLLSEELCEEIIYRTEEYACKSSNSATTPAAPTDVVMSNMSSKKKTSKKKNTNNKKKKNGWTTERHSSYATTDIPIEAVFGTFSNVRTRLQCLHCLCRLC